ncbi:MAG: DUF6265 family protein [Candidatus Acidiferrales bacterium]
MRFAALRALLRAACGTVLLSVALSLSAWAQQPAGSGASAAAQSAAAPATPPPAPPALPPKAKLADFAWLEGRWHGDWGPRIAEQTWLAPKAGVMTGIFQLVENDKTLVIELFTLVEKPGGIALYLRHFTPELLPWEKAMPTVLNLSGFDAKKVDFDNPVDGLPQHIYLLRLDADTFTLRSEIVPEEGDPQVTEITYHRQKPAPEKPNAGNGARR